MSASELGLIRARAHPSESITCKLVSSNYEVLPRSTFLLLADDRASPAVAALFLPKLDILAIIAVLMA